MPGGPAGSFTLTRSRASLLALGDPLRLRRHYFMAMGHLDGGDSSSEPSQLHRQLLGGTATTTVFATEAPGGAAPSFSEETGQDGLLQGRVGANPATQQDA